MFPFGRCFVIIAVVLTSGVLAEPAMAEAPAGADPRPAEATSSPGATETRSRNDREATIAPPGTGESERGRAADPSGDGAGSATSSGTPSTSESATLTGAGAKTPEAGSEGGDTISEGAADKAKEEAGKKPAARSSKSTVRRMAPPKVEELEALVIEGRIQKPEVFYVIGRAEADYRDQKLKKSFVKEILKSVEDNPF